ncbi:hypothetical protein I7I51_04777 [Histoplasma capsulatum]|uniref:Uncharacterized protein n=1 Tax=Ajellomyces capsulatus TaxID=5037 RepID=A0A8A1M1W1_AJECA|nr:predicted protein [Histoplasma mississippiense (nom. inval.)]EDN09384.1 predicted protein [Histoplasma mississippiense (nom. inval.)]QSS59981.1 hypothetical protein I7I51_04777 [Histoplasma capsulatum]
MNEKEKQHKTSFNMGMKREKKQGTSPLHSNLLSWRVHIKSSSWASCKPCHRHSDIGISLLRLGKLGFAVNGFHSRQTQLEQFQGLHEQRNELRSRGLRTGVVSFLFLEAAIYV